WRRSAANSMRCPARRGEDLLVIPEAGEPDRDKGGDPALAAPPAHHEDRQDRCCVCGDRPGRHHHPPRAETADKESPRLTRPRQAGILAGHIHGGRRKSLWARAALVAVIQGWGFSPTTFRQPQAL